MRGHRHSRAIATVLLVAALVAKLLVPAGWMPVSTQGGIAILLCSGDGPAQAWLDPAGKLHIGKQAGKLPSGDHPGKAKDPCPYAALTAPAAAPTAFALAEPLIAPAALPAPPIAGVAIGRGLAAPPPPATGPPHSA